jgi:DNA-binding HxlR family transcriptional regulator
VFRHVVKTIPPWVHYELTPKGHAHTSDYHRNAAWARRWMADRVTKCEEDGGDLKKELCSCPEEAS